MRVVISGSSGLIGTALVADLRAAGHDVLRLVRRTPAAPDERGWDPAAARIDAGTFDGVDAVVGLGGVPIGDRPWSGARKQLIRDSRNVPTEVLAAAVAEHGVPTFLSASAVGYYGNTGDRVTDESAPSGTGFLAEVCRDWEAATQKAADGGRAGGQPAHRAGARPGGRAARRAPAGVQARSSAGGSGPAPSTCRGSRSTTRSAASGTRWSTTPSSARSTSPGRRPSRTPSSRRPSPRRCTGRRRSPSPAFAIKSVLGAMGEELLLYGQRAVPAQLEKTGYQFRHLTLGDALSAALDGMTDHDVVIVGAGLAGLRAAAVLARRGLDVTRAGRRRPARRPDRDRRRGRVPARPRLPGAQHGLPGAARRRSTSTPLRLCPFVPGAAIRTATARCTRSATRCAAPPSPGRPPPTALFGPLAKARLVAWTAQVVATPPQRTATRIDRSAARDFAAAHLDGPVVEQFLRPFLSGVLGDRDLVTSAAYVRLVWRCFALGTIAVPADGMGALPALLADALPEKALVDGAAGHPRRTRPRRGRRGDAAGAGGRRRHRPAHRG